MHYIILLVVAISFVSSQKLPDRSKWTPLQCRSGVLGPNDDRMKVILACKPGCHYFCHARELGLLEESGLPSEKTYDEWVDQTFPEKHREFSKAWFSNCFRRYGTRIDLNDKECVMADALADCTWAVQSHLDCPKDGTPASYETEGGESAAAGDYDDDQNGQLGPSQQEDYSQY